MRGLVGYIFDESYALNFWEKGTSVRTMDVKLVNEGQSGTLAYVTSSISGGDSYFDHTIARGMVHALICPIPNLLDTGETSCLSDRY